MTKSFAILAFPVVPKTVKSLSWNTLVYNSGNLLSYVFVYAKDDNAISFVKFSFQNKYHLRIFSNIFEFWWPFIASRFIFELT